jgi:hypothetical protein
MRESPERVAWTILLISFAIFCLLAVTIPLGIRQFTVTAAERQPARVTAYGGAILMQTAESEAPTAIRPTELDREIQEGTILTTESSSQAVVWLFDASNLLVRNNSQVAILKTQTPRFNSSPRPAIIEMEVLNGKVIVGVASPPQDRSRQFQVHTPHGTILLEEGNYSVSVTETETEVGVRTVRAVGHAKLQSAGESITLGLGERGRIEAGRSPEGPLPGEHNLLVNGDFQQPLSTGWILWENHEKKEEEPGTGGIETVDGDQVVHFVRQGGNQQHAENGILQELDLDVRDASSLGVRLNVRLIHQSLSGGGWLSSEFPLMVRLRFRDANGREHDWVRGFYYANWEDLSVRDDEWSRGILIPQDLWHSFEAGNLMLSLGDQKPAHLISLSVYASGHDYESMVSDVGIFVKE